MPDFYYDDPVEESSGNRRSFKGIISLILLFVAGGAYVQTTLAANISLNSGSRVEFGQGVSMVAACSGANSLTVTPNSEFVNSSGSGAYYLKSITVSGIPAECNGKDFNISFYDNVPNSEALPIFETSKSVVTVYNNAGTFQEGFQGTGSVVSSTSGGFTVSFKSPAALSSNVMKVTLQSTEHRDWAQASVLAGVNTTCALLSSGSVKCYGGNEKGEIGNNGTSDMYTTPQNVSGLSSGVTAISVGAFFNCALLNSDSVQCWGRNQFSQLGAVTTGEVSKVPLTVSGLGSGVTAISSGTSHTCALFITGAVKCWGFNQSGQLGDGTTTTRLNPVTVSGLSSGVTAISAGADHTCALLSTGALKCWGQNSRGALGDGTLSQRNTPVNVSGLSSGVTAVSSGGRYTCAILTTGALKCWGLNDNGVLGDGTSVDKSAPVDVSGLSSGVNSVSAGAKATCAILIDGTAKCWGNNQYGQLGNGTTTSTLIPVTASALGSDISSISTGRREHTVAILSTGTFVGVGFNFFGALGNGSGLESNANPTAVQPTGIRAF